MIELLLSTTRQILLFGAILTPLEILALSLIHISEPTRPY